MVSFIGSKGESGFCLCFNFGVQNLIIWFCDFLEDIFFKNGFFVFFLFLNVMLVYINKDVSLFMCFIQKLLSGENGNLVIMIQYDKNGFLFMW